MSGSWDLGLDYSRTYKLLLSRIKDHYKRRAFRHYTYAIILLIQLRNGSRVSEAIEALRRFIESGEKKVEVRVRKHKNLEYRLMVLPKELSHKDLMPCKPVLEEVDDMKLKKRVQLYARKELGINTHSLRYAFITYLLKKGVSPSLIAKITHHKNLNYILTYTQQKTADKILEEL